MQALVGTTIVSFTLELHEVYMVSSVVAHHTFLRRMKAIGGEIRSCSATARELTRLSGDIQAIVCIRLDTSFWHQIMSAS